MVASECATDNNSLRVSSPPKKKQMIQTTTDDANALFLTYTYVSALFSAGSQFIFSFCVLVCVVSSSNCKALQSIHPKENSMQTNEWLIFLYLLQSTVYVSWMCAYLSSCLLVIVDSSTPGWKFTVRKFIGNFCHFLWFFRWFDASVREIRKHTKHAPSTKEK